MRIFLISILAILVPVGCSTPRSQGGNSSDGRVFSSQFLVERVVDFRSLVLSEQDVAELATNHLCSVRIGDKVSSKRAISTGDGRKLSEIVKAYLGEPYDGQVKVVSQNSIVQTSIETYDPSEQNQIEVHPGDLVFIDARD